MNGRAELCASDGVKSRGSTRLTRLLVFSSGPPLHTRSPSPAKLRVGGWRRLPTFDPVRVLGEQWNHEVERLDLPPHALDIHLFLTQNLVRILHGYLPAPHRTFAFFSR